MPCRHQPLVEAITSARLPPYLPPYRPYPPRQQRLSGGGERDTNNPSLHPWRDPHAAGPDGRARGGITEPHYQITAVLEPGPLPPPRHQQPRSTRPSPSSQPVTARHSTSHNVTPYLQASRCAPDISGCRHRRLTAAAAEGVASCRQHRKAASLRGLPGGRTKLGGGGGGGGGVGWQSASTGRTDTPGPRPRPVDDLAQLSSAAIS